MKKRKKMFETLWSWGILKRMRKAIKETDNQTNGSSLQVDVLERQSRNAKYGGS